MKTKLEIHLITFMGTKFGSLWYPISFQIVDLHLKWKLIQFSI
jgi:hypothetical protein